MAQRIIESLEDDLTGGPADETVKLALAGQDWQIDLSSANAAKLRKALATYVEHARKVTGASTPRRVRAARASAGRDNTAIRTWAKERGVKINDRGRIPANIVADFEAANG